MNEPTPAEILDKQLRDRLHFWGIPYDFEIEEEAKGMLVAALSADDITKVYIDSENGLCIDYEGDDYNGSK